MLKSAEYLAKDRPYAVDLGSYRLVDGQGRGELSAVWFRRKRLAYNGPMRTVACAGRLWDYQQPRQDDAAGFLAAFDDGRYGGDCEARWDGTNLWCLADESARAAYLDILRPALESFPAVPAGYDGWWRFPR